MADRVDLAPLLAKCRFPPAGAAAVCAVSGGADSTALMILAVAAGCDVSAVHVHHGLRPSADHDAACAEATARRFGVPFRVEHVEIVDGANLEARARAARRAALGDDALTGHTADDQAETLLLALLRGAGATGIAAIRPDRRHPILALRSHETRSICDELGVEVADDPTNQDPRFRRNRVRHELLPLLDHIAARDMVPLLTRTADLVRDDDDLLNELATSLDPTDAAAVAAAPKPIARRALRRWLSVDGYPPDAAAVERVLAVAAGDAVACEVAGVGRVHRRQQRLQLVTAEPTAG